MQRPESPRNTRLSPTTSGQCDVNVGYLRVGGVKRLLAMAERGSIDEYEILVQPRPACRVPNTIGHLPCVRRLHSTAHPAGATYVPTPGSRSVPCRPSTGHAPCLSFFRAADRLLRWEGRIAVQVPLWVVLRLRISIAFASRLLRWVARSLRPRALPMQWLRARRTRPASRRSRRSTHAGSMVIDSGTLSCDRPEDYLPPSSPQVASRLAVTGIAGSTISRFPRSSSAPTGRAMWTPSRSSWVAGQSAGTPAARAPMRRFDNNDSCMQRVDDIATGEEFFAYTHDCFDWLYRSGAEGRPGTMSVGLHARIIGRPGRIGALARPIEQLQRHEGVWLCNRREIAEHGRTHHA